MKRLLLLSLFALLAPPVAAQPTTADAWINEVDYDQPGRDSGEFVEVVVENLATFSGTFIIERYNGSGAAKYGGNVAASLAVVATSGDFSFLVEDYDTGGLQNGSPDGVALCYDDGVSETLIQFVSYEGTFTASDGCAEGATSTEYPGDSGAESTGLSGTGSDFSDFTPSTLAAVTRGAVNDGQTLDSTQPESYTVTLDPNSATIDEEDVSDNSAQFAVVLAIADDDGDGVTARDVTGDVVEADGDGDVTISAIGGADCSASGATFTFPSGSADGATCAFEVTAVDDADYEGGSETNRIDFDQLTNASSGGGLTLSITEDETLERPYVVINEVRIDQEGDDDDEYFELEGAAGTSLTGLWYVAIGSSGASNDNYGVIESVTDLTGQSIPADGYFLAAEGTFSLRPRSEVDLTTTLDFQNGVSVTHVLVTNFTGSDNDDLDTDDDGTLDVTPWDDVVHAVGLVDEPGTSGVVAYYGEALGFDNVGPDGAFVPAHVYRNESTGTFMIGALDETAVEAEDTPGGPNPPAVSQSGFADAAGYRLLSVPIVSATGSDLAEVDIVQGARGQYPDGDDSVFIAFDGSNFRPLVSTSDAIPAGRGFFKYFFDVDVNPDDGVFGGGTSVSHDLDGFVFSLAGTSPTSDVMVSFDDANGNAATDGAYMIGNPFDAPFDLFGISLAPGEPGTLLSSTFQAWDGTMNGGSGGYRALDGSTDDGTFIDVFQGVFALIDYAAAPGSGPTFVMSYGERDPDGSETPPFHWLRATPLSVGLDLTGETASGTPLGDGLADLWFRESGSFGRDRVDAAEIAPPGDAVAQLALVEDGEHRAVRGVPAVLDGAVETPVVFRTTVPGAFVVSFDPETELPEGLSATLTDRVTGLTYRFGETVAFESDSTGWTERFLLTVSGTSVATGAGTDAVLRIGEVYPNPSTGRARLAVEVDAPQRVTIHVIDALGRIVSTAHVGDLTSGAVHEVELPTGLAQGAYVVRVLGETFAETRRMVVVR